MPVKRIPFEQTPNRQVNDLQRNVNDSTSVLRNGPMGDGVLLTDISFPYSALTAPSYVHQGPGNSLLIDHQLGRALQGWIVCRFQADTGIQPPFEPVSPSAFVGFTVDPTRQLVLDCASVCVLSIWVF